jgi:ribonuclease HII
MARRPSRRSARLFKFDQPFVARYALIAGLDEAGRGPLAGPVVAAAIILPKVYKIPLLDDSKRLTAEQRESAYAMIQRCALAIGVGLVDHLEIDRINIHQAGFAAMRLALAQLIIKPFHILIDGFPLPHGPSSQTNITGGDGKSAHIAAASIVAKVTRDALMQTWDRRYPGYGFGSHKGYGTPQHLAALKRLGPCPIHRYSYAPVQAVHRNTERRLTDDAALQNGGSVRRHAGDAALQNSGTPVRQ